MKLTKVLLRQHLGRHFKTKWANMSKKLILQSKAFDVLENHNIPVYDPKDLFAEEQAKPKISNLDNLDLAPKLLVRDQTHPFWKDRVCRTFNDFDVPAEGLSQALVLTKSINRPELFPKVDNLTEWRSALDGKVQQIILASQLLDSEQVKLPKIKEPERPAWNFPRTYGISDKRRNKLLISKLLQLIEMNGDLNLVRNRELFNNLRYSFNFERLNDLVQFELVGDTLVTSSQSQKSFDDCDTTNMPLLDIYPVVELLGLTNENIYELRNIYPINLKLTRSIPHTLFVHYNGTEVRNLFEVPVTDDQAASRALIKAFTVSAAYAREKYGNVKGKLPEPVVLNCVQTNGQVFNFGRFQLNTIDINATDGGAKNIWCQSDRLNMFSRCEYVSGRPLLEGYNHDVMKLLWMFYHNI